MNPDPKPAKNLNPDPDPSYFFTLYNHCLGAGQKKLIVKRGFSHKIWGKTGIVLGFQGVKKKKFKTCPCGFPQKYVFTILCVPYTGILLYCNVVPVVINWLYSLSNKIKLIWMNECISLHCLKKKFQLLYYHNFLFCQLKDRML